MIDPARIRKAHDVARRDLLEQRDPAGHWIGELSSSALSTATAVSALSLVLRHCGNQDARRGSLQRLINRGLRYLAESPNEDGGWGDTDKSLLNIATTMLVRAAFHLAGEADKQTDLLQAAQGYIGSRGGLEGLRRRYGRDKTFAVPILTNCALAGLVDWREVSPLPFELACLPHATFRFLGLPVVSYAIPALVAIGQARYFHRKPLNPIVRLMRRMAIGPSLKKLQQMQPDSGGYLEATPLTSFVVMSLAGIGRAYHPVAERGVDFLVDSARDDGSWPIDTNLATWATTLSINALAASGERVGWLACSDWLLSCQHLAVHPFTNAAPGGWGWTDLSGAVPDADDTAGALLALAAISESSRDRDAPRIKSAAHAGIQWLFNLQNSDGGWPTFCRGWGKLPFDRSGVDLTAHALRAIHQWRAGTYTRSERAAVRRGLAFLANNQREDGSWLPLWFGNQHDASEENPVYGTAKVLLAYRDLNQIGDAPPLRGAKWLIENQNADGGWGGHPGSSEEEKHPVSSVEETAVAVEALLSAENDPEAEPATAAGVSWLVAAVEAGRHRETNPIGFYFAKLWYYEKLYPLIFTVSALGQALGRFPESDPTSRPGETETAH